MEADIAVWIAVDSKNEMAAKISPNDTTQIVTGDPNSWGYFQFANGKRLPVGYSDLGLGPTLSVVGQFAIVGINELLKGFDKETLEEKFSYRMPTIFHEFLSAHPLVVRDEIGFVGLSPRGKEVWRYLTTGPIDEFVWSEGRVTGKTIDGEKFDFAVPA